MYDVVYKCCTVNLHGYLFWKNLYELYLLMEMFFLYVLIFNFVSCPGFRCLYIVYKSAIISWWKMACRLFFLSSDQILVLHLFRNALKIGDSSTSLSKSEGWDLRGYIWCRITLPVLDHLYIAYSWWSGERETLRESWRLNITKERK